MHNAAQRTQHAPSRNTVGSTCGGRGTMGGHVSRQVGTAGRHGARQGHLWCNGAGSSQAACRHAGKGTVPREKRRGAHVVALVATLLAAAQHLGALALANVDVAQDLLVWKGGRGGAGVRREGVKGRPGRGPHAVHAEAIRGSTRALPTPINQTPAFPPQPTFLSWSSSTCGPCSTPSSNGSPTTRRAARSAARRQNSS